MHCKVRNPVLLLQHTELLNLGDLALDHDEDRRLFAPTVGVATPFTFCSSHTVTPLFCWEQSLDSQI
ncbi:hypothetical protein, partial [Bacteroides thetaiotaomicron]|uniref:hypothetical protein n=1 Tax=Bacteroides thetaiotaomicron TaxID=818 RepID=UPI001A92060A